MKAPGIWVTIGKKGFSQENFGELIKPRITGIRINTGRSKYPWIYDALECYKKLDCPMERILLDIGNTKPRLLLMGKTSLVIKNGDQLTISGDIEKEADAYLSAPCFFDEICVGDTVYFGDGEMLSTVKEIQEGRVCLISCTEGVLGDAVSIGIKGKDFFHFYISEEEIRDVNEILEKYPVQLILSFVENSKNIAWARKVFSSAVSIIPKIETSAAVDNIDSILEVSECIFIGRGDLALSVGIEKIGIVQEMLIEKAHKAGCRVVVGTGTLDSLRWNDAPLRAEVIDITNSCMKGVDAIALTTETGGVEKPFKAIEYLENVIDYIEEMTLKGDVKR